MEELTRKVGHYGGSRTKGGALWGNSHERWGIMGELTLDVRHYGGTHKRWGIMGELTQEVRLYGGTYTKGGSLWRNSHERWGILGELTR